MQSALRSAADHLGDQVTDRLMLYHFGLRGVRGALSAVGEQGISRTYFRNYSLTRDIDREFPGARGFGFIRRVPEVDQARFIEQARRDGQANFSLRQFVTHPGERFIIQYIEPETRNREAIGLDIASEAARREAAIAAMQSGEVRLSAPITLVQASGKTQQSFLILLPVFRSGSRPETEAARLRETFGWTYAPLLMEEVLSGLTIERNAVHLRLYDVTTAGQEKLFYDTQLADGPLEEIAEERVSRELFGRQWQIRLAAHPGFIQELGMISPTVVLLIGFLMSGLLAALAGALSRSRQQHALMRTEQAKLAAIVESSADGIIGKTLEGRVTSWNKAAEELFGYSAEEAIGRLMGELIVPALAQGEEGEILAVIRQGGRIASFHTQRQHKDGHLVDVAVSIAPIFGAGGRVLGASKTVRDISAQKAAEAQVRALNQSLEEQVVQRTDELRQLNLLLGTVLRSASEVSIIATDLNGIIRVFNSGAERLLGYAASEVVGSATPALFHLADEVNARAAELSALYRLEVESFRAFVLVPELDGAETREWNYVRKDGSTFPVTLVVTAMRDDQGMLTGYLGIGLDMTTRKAAERQLAESLQTTQAILDTAVNPVLTVDVQGVVRTFNPAGCVVFGHEAEQVIGQPFSQLLADESRGVFTTYLQRCVAHDDQQTVPSQELMGQRKDGQVFPLQLSTGAVSMADERILVCIITDLSAQQQQRAELEAARDQLLLAADAAQLGIWSWRPESDELRWNMRMFDIYGLPSTLLDGGLSIEHWRACIHPEDTEAALNSLDEVVASGGGFAPVFRIIRPDGEIRHVQAGAQVEFDLAGNPLMVTGINRDITAQRELEAYLLSAKEQADAASAAKSSFLANMSHEIRTPMNAVLGMLQLVQSTQLSTRQHDYVSKAQTAARSLLGLLNDILDYSKIEAGKLQLDVHPFELELLLQDLAVVLAGNQGDKAVEVLFDIDARLPQLLIGDSLRLQQVLINLAGNALKFTQQGQVTIQVGLLPAEPGHVGLHIAVRDTGIGISPEQLTRIFEGFTQAEASTTRRFGGTGLGLVICKRLIALMGGELRVDSQPGVGSCFWFELVLEVAPQSPVAWVAAALPETLHVLVVDDNPLAAEVVQRSLLAQGWQAVCVDSGQAAITAVLQARATGTPYQLVLMDLCMPQLDGLSAARLLHEACAPQAAPPIIMITAYGREALADAEHSGDQPFQGYLSKPTTPQQLLDAVRRVLHGEAPSGSPAKLLTGCRLQDMQVLVVEDNPLNRQVADELLSGEGAHVTLAAGGLAGVEAALHSSVSFDAVLMDMQMPDIDGLEATRRIRQHLSREQLPIIAMTANASQDDREACMAAGMNEHVAKPIDLNALVATLLGHTLRPPAPMVEEPGREGGLLEREASILARFGGNRQVIQRVLSQFVPDQQRLLEQLEASLVRQDTSAAAGQLHTIKGSAATLGARQLARQATVYEQALLDVHTPDWSATAAWRDQLNAVLQASYTELLALFGEASEVTGEGEVLADHAWREALQAIRGLLQSGNLQAIDQVEQLQAQAPVAAREAFAQVVSLVGALNFPAACTALDALLGASTDE
ncbi:MAG: PAS domain S-box protein [Gammaproteobacteria bacterium]|nr:PAS domain S-box protein [Gammaproteobacteria bacterium]MBU2140287.1 PAS domain S-box protein [Gammaproteobacteria bacterium]